MITLLSNLSNGDVHRALVQAFPGEGFHVVTPIPNQHEIEADRPRTAAELQDAINAWKGGAAAAHARKIAVERVRQIMANHLMRFAPTAAPANEDAASKAWGAHVFAISTNGLRLIEEIQSAKTPDAVDLSAGWPA